MLWAEVSVEVTYIVVWAEVSMEVMYRADNLQCTNPMYSWLLLLGVLTALLPPILRIGCYFVT